MNFTKKIVLNLEKVGSDVEENMRKIGTRVEKIHKFICVVSVSTSDLISR